MTGYEERLSKLADYVMSPSVQVPLPKEVHEVSPMLSGQVVAQVFIDHVPGVKKFLFRGQRGQFSLKFLQLAYQDGFAAFRGTPLDNHLTRLFRVIVHYGHEGKPEASKYLTQVAEAFMDCQAVQARVVEKVGLQIEGVTSDFQSLVIGLVSEYKTLALKMLAAERLAQRLASDDGNPTHYENRLTADLGSSLGLDMADLRRAELDQHAKTRFPRLHGRDKQDAVQRCRELFDMHACLHALMSEVNSFSDASSSNSMSRQFLNWAADRLIKKHVVFDEETMTRVDVDFGLVLAIMETIFWKVPAASEEEVYRGESLHSIFSEASGNADQKEDAALEEDIYQGNGLQRISSKASRNMEEIEEHAASDEGVYPGEPLQGIFTVSSRDAEMEKNYLLVASERISNCTLQEPNKDIEAGIVLTQQKHFMSKKAMQPSQRSVVAELVSLLNLLWQFFPLLSPFSRRMEK